MSCHPFLKLQVRIWRNVQWDKENCTSSPDLLMYGRRIYIVGGSVSCSFAERWTRRRNSVRELLPPVVGFYVVNAIRFGLPRCLLPFGVIKERLLCCIDPLSAHPKSRALDFGQAEGPTSTQTSSRSSARTLELWKSSLSVPKLLSCGKERGA